MTTNIIHNISITKINLHKIPKWRIFTKYKMNKELNKYINNFLLLDIFIASDDFITFIMSFDNKFIENNIDNIKFNRLCLSLKISDTIIHYFPKSNRFEIIDNSYKYYVYKKTNLNSFIKIKWDKISNDIKQFYIEKILYVSEFC